MINPNNRETTQLPNGQFIKKRTEQYSSVQQLSQPIPISVN